jgi:23S rRNA (cytosine1962-C5)-methyltransferase
MPAADSPADMPAADSPADMPAADSRAADMPAADSRAAEVPPADARVHTTSVFEPGKIVRPISANIILESPQRRRGEAMPTRVLFGSSPGVVQFVEDGITFAVDIAAGQKTGTFLDLRGLRRAIATMDLADKSVLNLFAYTGMLGRCAEAAGATTIVQVDQSQRALDFAREHHVIDPAKHQFIVDDIFERMPTGDFDLVIVDPPAMTSRKSQVPKVLAAYRKLYRAARERVRPGGLLVAACCTSRIERAAFHRVVRDTTAFAMERELPAEVDHPVGFKEADYLKIALWRRQA